MSLINIFLKTELTCIPSILDRLFGKYYNNALCNAATWIFFIWCALHFIFDTFLDGLFKKMRYKEFTRVRLRKSLWYLGFFSSAFVYSGASLYRDSIELFKLRLMQLPYEGDMAGQSLIGLIVLVTFFIHSAFWESLRYNSINSFANYTFLAIFLVLTHFLRVMEVSFSLIALISLSQIFVCLTQCMDIMMNNPVLYLMKFMVAWSILILEMLMYLFKDAFGLSYHLNFLMKKIIVRVSNFVTYD